VYDARPAQIDWVNAHIVTAYRPAGWHAMTSHGIISGGSGPFGDHSHDELLVTAVPFHVTDAPASPNRGHDCPIGMGSGMQASQLVMEGTTSSAPPSGADTEYHQRPSPGMSNEVT
jgi:hypothetical protein